MFRRSAPDNSPASLRHYPNGQHLVLEGKHAGQVNFSHLPDIRPSKGAERFEAAVGKSLGAIMLPMQRGVIVPETSLETSRALNINVFRDTTAARGDTYLLASDDALEAQGRHRTGHDEHGIIAMLADGDILPVGKKSWLPLVGHDVGQLETDERLARIYNGVHSDQGAFHVRDGDLIWVDSGRLNRSVLIQDITGIQPEHVPYQEFLPAGRLAMRQAVALQGPPEQTMELPQGAAGEVVGS